MNERRKPYPFDRLEPKWQTIWDETRAFHAPNPGEENFDAAQPKYYVLDMFPYPSGAGLHVGHPEGYTATDIIARYKRLKGFNVLHPMGWDAFGLPAEQYAIKTGQHPAITTRENVAKFKTQLKRIGFSYDWEREINTTDPAYYKWTQWIFLQIYNSWFNPETKRAEPISTYRGDDPDDVRLAYVAEVPVNWCPELGTVLANEEVIDGKSEVGGFPVVRRPMRQWMLRITAFADRLLDELDGLDWPESIKALQRNWIGRSEGAEIEFVVAGIADPGQSLSVFTTRPDTLYGATYMVLAPENPLVDRIVTHEHSGPIAEYRGKIAAKSDLERTDLAKEKTGVFTGAFAVNPVNSERIPIWIADYVLMGYGTGAIMGVPAHDTRDLEFARKFQLAVTPVVQAPGKTPEESIGYLDVGTAINSPLLDGLAREAATAKIIDWLEQNGHGRRDIRYKLRDWLFSRQRYWGEPFPIVWRNGKHEALPESELPLEPPALEDFKPTGTGEPPLAKAKDWIRYSDDASRETNTMPQWAGSCWYYLRFCDPPNSGRFVGEEPERYWMGTQRVITLTWGEWEKRLRALDVHASRPRENRKEFVTFSVVTPERAKKIEAATGLQVEGFRDFIDVFALRHIKQQHGPEREAASGHLPIEFEDLLSIPDIVSAPDRIISGGRTALGLPSIRYEKRVNGTVFYLEEVLLGRRLLAAKTMYKMKATASHAGKGLAQTSRTLRRTDQIIAEFTRRVNARPSGGGVDLYIGGVEHAVLHLLYARFWHKVLFDLGHVSKPEPFQRLVNQGMILGEDGRKMSKRWGNVIDPLDVIEIYGADAFRCYEMFMGPLEQMKPWSMKGVEGVSRFLARVWRLIMQENQAGEWELSGDVKDVDLTKQQQKITHATVKKVTEDIESLSFNTAISQMMIFVNAFTNAPAIPLSAMRTFLVLLNPFAPHITSELWQQLKGSGEITEQSWPSYDERFLVEDEVEIVLQVNGKLRDRITVALDATDAELEAAARANSKVRNALGGKTIRKVVVVPKKLVNVVAG